MKRGSFSAPPLVSTQRGVKALYAILNRRFLLTRGDHGPVLRRVDVHRHSFDRLHTVLRQLKPHDRCLEGTRTESRQVVEVEVEDEVADPPDNDAVAVG